MKIMKCGMNDFAKVAKLRPIVCFGASYLISQMCSLYHQHKLWKNIIAVADNDVSKHGKDFYYLWKIVPIISVDELVAMYEKDNNIALIIMLSHINCLDVIKQLNSISEFQNMECYIYSMFPFCETFPQIPKKMLQLKKDNQQIPKTIHYIWLGEKQIPEQHLKWIESWKKYCPDYEIKIWNENNYDVEKNKYMQQAYKAKKYAFVSDCMRLDIIYEYGGIYLDTDVELLKNLDELLYYPAYFGLGLHHGVNTGLGFGSIPKHNLIKEMRDVYDDVSFIRNDGQYNRITCDFYQTEVLKWYGFSGGNNYHIIENTAIFPTEYFCPKNTGFGIMKITENCYSIHHFGMSGLEPHEVQIRKDSQSFFNFDKDGEVL